MHESFNRDDNWTVKVSEYSKLPPWELPNRKRFEHLSWLYEGLLSGG